MVVLTGTAQERGLTAAVAEQMSHPAVDLCGETSLGALALLVDGARVVISNDTGISHVAAARRKPSVILFSASDPRRWAPANRELHRVVFVASRRAVDSAISEALDLLDHASGPNSSPRHATRSAA
jgi:ADP-heptose:LPS heptosyltransferase